MATRSSTSATSSKISKITIKVIRANSPTAPRPLYRPRQAPPPRFCRENPSLARASITVNPPTKNCFTMKHTRRGASCRKKRMAPVRNIRRHSRTSRARKLRQKLVKSPSQKPMPRRRKISRRITIPHRTTHRGASAAAKISSVAAIAAPLPPAQHRGVVWVRQEGERTTPRGATIPPARLRGGPNFSRRSSGGLPRWVLADASSEASAAATPAEDASSSVREEVPEAPTAQIETSESGHPRNGADLSEDQVNALASDLVEAKHEETQDHTDADAVVGGAEFDDESEEEPEEGEEILSAEPSELSEEETEEVEERHAADLAEAEADAAHESAEHAVASGEHVETGREEAAPDGEHGHREAEVIEATASESASEAATAGDEVTLLPEERRTPHIDGPSAPHENFPRASASTTSHPPPHLQPPVLR